MSIKDLLIPNYLNDLEQQDAETDNIRANTRQQDSATMLNMIQGNRINALLPGEIEGQALDNTGKRKDNYMKDVQAEGQSIINNINTLKIDAQRHENEKLRVEAEAADTNMKLTQEAKRAEILRIKAETKRATDLTHIALAEMDIKKRKAYIEEYYPRAAGAMDIVNKLAASGDMPAANKVYQQLLKTLPPEFLQFEGKNGVDLLGPEIDSQDLKTLDIFSNYLKQMVPADSQIGQLEQQKLANQGALDTAQARNSGQTEEDLLMNTKRRLDAERVAGQIVEEPLMSGLLGAGKTKSAIVGTDGKTIKPIIAKPYQKLKQVATQQKLQGNDITQGITRAFKVDKVEGIGSLNNETLDNVIVPRMPELREVFDRSLQAALKGQSIVLSEDMEKAYDIAITQAVDTYSSMFE